MGNNVIDKASFKQNMSSILDTCDLEDFAFLREFDCIFATTNHKKYIHSQDIIEYISDTKIPALLDINKITFLALLDYFQKKYVFSNFWLDMDLFLGTRFHIAGKNKSYISAQLTNFPHLIGIKKLRDSDKKVIHRKKPQEFLDGVIYQWIVVDACGGYEIDMQKLEVFPWIAQTLSNPTYIFPKSAFNKNYTRIEADLCFARACLNSDNYSYHLIFLKYTGSNKFTLVSQFGLIKKEYFRLKKIFDFEKRVMTKDNWRPR